MNHRTGMQAAASVAALLLWLAWWLGLESPPFSPPAAVGLAWLPLAPALPLLTRGSVKAAGWCSLAGVFYAGFALMEIVANPEDRWRAGVALTLTLVMIAAQVRLIRTRPAQAS